MPATRITFRSSLSRAMNPPILAVVDIGSNSIKILVAARGPGAPAGPELIPLFQKTFETRISGGLGQERSRLSEPGMEAGLRAITELFDLAKPYAPTHRKIVATSAVRDAQNRAVFSARVEAAAGAPIEVLSGEDEALLIARGIQTDPALGGAKSFCIMDLGGGSLECIRYVNDAIAQAVSLQLGAVRLTEKYAPDPQGPFPPVARAAVAEETRRAYAASGFQFLPGGKVVASGGAFALVRALFGYRRGITDEAAWPAEILRADLVKLLDEISPLTAAERARIPNFTRERADIMPAALVTMITMLELAGADCACHSWNNLRFGVAARFFAGSPEERGNR
jgi:exopolyphosphatase/guanosine-5'-triphosphate,3'-diphosphate pyrophosphatase